MRIVELGGGGGRLGDLVGTCGTSGDWLESNLHSLH